MNLPLLVKRLSAFVMLGMANAEAITNDVTLNVEVLGNPFTTYPQYMRNIWSLRAWNDLLYIGYGNANNTGPDPYSGSLNLIALNPTNNTFSSQGPISEQQIDHFRTMANQLIMPGFNPEGLGGTGYTNGDFYIQKSGTTWTRIVTVPQATHNFDMYYFNNTLFAALGSYYPTIVSSVNNGINWSSAISPTILNNSGYRVFSLFALSNVLYSMTGEIQKDGNITPCLLQYYPSNKQFAAQGSINSNYFTNFCPNSGYNIALNHIIARTTNIGANLVYIMGEIPNDINWDYPLGLFWCTNVNYGKKVNLTPGVQPWDIKPNATNGNVVWVLESSPVDTSGTNFLIQVRATMDFSNWTQVLQFTNESFARSFEMLDGDMYFGMGCTTNLLGTDVGDVLRVRSQYFSTVLTPTVIWTNPVSIAAGTALSAIQLNAKANVAGTFAYAPNLGIILSPGTNTLTTVFTPTDKVDYGSVTDSVTIVVGLSTLLSLALTPAPASVATGLTQQFTATGTYSDGSTQNLNSSVVWSSSSVTNATITSAGLAKGVAAGSSIITATLLGLSGTSTLTVAPPILISVTTLPGSASVTAGSTQQYTANGTYTDGSSKSLTSLATWSSSSATNATISATGLAKGVAPGSSIITATASGVSGASILTVTPPTLVSLAVSPATASLAAGLTQQFAATGTYTDGNTKSLTTLATWSSTTTNANIISAGLAKGFAVGSASITATLSGISGSSALSVTSPALVSLAVTPATASVTAGTTQQYSATGTYTDGSVKSLNALATWISSTTNATINSTGLATGVAAGSSIITATALGVSGSASLTINSRSLVSLAVTPAYASVAAGLTQQFAATGTYSDGSTNSLTASALWSSSSATNATISSAGLAKGVASGSSIITAAVSGISGTATLAITTPALASLAVSPTSASVAVGLTQQFTATGTYTDGSTKGLTSSAAWSSSKTTNVTVNSAGLAKGVATGTSTITASVTSVSGKATLTVSSAIFVLLVVTPPSVSVPAGMTQQFTATGTYSDGTTQNVTALVVWSSNATNATVSSAGLAEALAPGSSIITATMKGVSGAATLATSGTNDVTADVEFLGNPFSSYAPYARNIWSMIPYHGLLYFGYGNSSSLSPSPDAGPVYVVAFDPTNATFLTQCNVSDQQIDHYRVLGESLVIPGQKMINADQGFGNYYVQETNGWTDFANIPQGTLIFDMYEYQGLWFAALGSYGTTILCSTNHGTNWSGALNANLAALGNTGQRVYSFFELNDTLYSMTLVLLPDYNLAATLLRFDTNEGVFVTNSEAGPNALATFCPNTSIPLGRDYCIVRATNVNNGLLYILGAITNDMQWDPIGLFWATNVNAGTKVNLPAETQPWDILVDTNGSAWVLESTPIKGSTNYWVQVVGTQDFANWHELLRFQSSTFARSFALLNGDFYFGLGCGTNQLSTATGNILRVKSEYFHSD